MVKKVQVEQLNLSDSVSETYKKFFNKFAEIETLPLKEWRTNHILAYICKKYEEYYKLKYTFKFNNPAPSKSFEVFQIKKLANMLSSDPEILKNYIDWIFQYKIIEKKKRITSLGYFTHADIVNEYKFKYLFNKKDVVGINRSDQLPENVAILCSTFGFDIRTYGELAFVKKMPNQDKLFQELQSYIDINILDKIA